MLIKRNMQVEYESTRTPGRKFKGRVFGVYANYAVVEHESEPKFTHVQITRLKVAPRYIPVAHKGRTA